MTGSRAPRRGRYEPLRAHLAGIDDATLTLPFRIVEDLVGGELPTSAWKHRAWWSNGGHSQATAWLDAGFEVEAVDQRSGWVRFRRMR